MTGWPERLFALALVVWAATLAVSPGGALRLLMQVALFILGAVVLLRLARRGIRSAIWSLRNRLCVAYLFIAVVPISLILILAAIGTYIFVGQVGIYLVNSELDRRTTNLRNAADFLLNAPESRRTEALQEMAAYYSKRFPGLEILIQDSREVRVPETAAITHPPEGWGTVSGIVERDRMLYAWAHAMSDDREVTVMAPLPPAVLSTLVPQLGEVSYMTLADGATAPQRAPRLVVDGKRVQPATMTASDPLPPAVNGLDMAVEWFTLVPAAVWDQPTKQRNVVFSIRTRFSAVFRVITGDQADFSEKIAAILFVGVGILFLLVEIGSLVIGVNLTRTITGAVHNLYEGTQKVRVGDFHHRIRVDSRDQIGELSISFNRMTENLERLLEVSKEKERLQAELELAREVQTQLYPKSAPQMRTLSLLAACAPARMVSGDYFDYQPMANSRVALALGDVAGKGISAALLMATVGSSLRTQLRNCAEHAADGGAPLAVSQLVSQLNKQIFSDTAPEKYLTFYFGVYDDATGQLTYTNAGHLPPMLVRNGEVTRLDVNGIVVGAFPFAQYGESTVQLEPGDLLVCFTDGITEPENDYGEMFGEERLADVLVRNADRGNQEIVDAVLDAVREWTGSPELQDDMTMLVARRL